jgi:Sel1 repeat
MFRFSGRGEKMRSKAEEQEFIKKKLEYGTQAQAGDPYAQYQLAKMYQQGGTNFDADHKLAIHWFTQAAKGNLTAAKVQLAWCYDNGHGVAKDPKKAAKWYDEATKDGDPYAQQKTKKRLELCQGDSGHLKNALFYTLSADQPKDSSKAVILLKEEKYSSPTIKFEKNPPLLSEEKKAFNLVDFQKMEKDYNLINSTIVNLFPNVELVPLTEEAIPVHRYLIYQLIWTFKYLVEMAVLENNGKWLKHNLLNFKQGFGYIKNHLTMVDEKLFEETQRVLKEMEILLKGESYGDIALRWIENFISLGGSLVRDLGKMWRIAKAKEKLIQISIGISQNNNLALLQAENYQQHLQQKIFYRDQAPIIAAHNRGCELVILENKLKKNPEDPDLLSRKQILSAEQKAYDLKEEKTKNRIGEQRYAEMIKKRRIRLEKTQSHMDLNLLIQLYLQTIEDLNLKDWETHNNLLYSLDLLQKALTKTFSCDNIELNCQVFKQYIDNAVSVVRDFKNLTRIPSLEKLITDDHKLLAGKILFSPPWASSVRSMSEKFRKADYSDILTIICLRSEYLAIHSAISSSDDSERETLIATLKQQYEEVICNVAEYFLKFPLEQHCQLLFGIDMKSEYTALQVKTRYRELQLIFHSDKLTESKTTTTLTSRITEIRNELVVELRQRKLINPLTQLVVKFLDILNQFKNWLESLSQ